MGSFASLGFVRFSYFVLVTVSLAHNHRNSKFIVSRAAFGVLEPFVFIHFSRGMEGPQGQCVHVSFLAQWVLLVLFAHGGKFSHSLRSYCVESPEAGQKESPAPFTTGREHVLFFPTMKLIGRFLAQLQRQRVGCSSRVSRPDLSTEQSHSEVL